MAERQYVIIVVDDEADIRRFVRVKLQGAGYSVVEADSGAAALQAIRTHRPDLIIMDVMMPGMSGLEVLSVIRQEPEFIDTPVLFLSAASDLATKISGFELGAQDYMTKPIDLRELVARVGAFISAKVKREKLLAAASQLATESQRLQQEALVDPLTGLGNRRALMQGAGPLVNEACASGRPLAVCMLDIDHFKRINDTYGHGFGDLVLKQVAQVIRGCFREGDLCTRYGGEEFAAVVAGVDVQTASRIAERARQTTEAMRIVNGEELVQVTISAGLAGFPEDGSSMEALLEVADQQLYAAKRAGRNRVFFRACAAR